MAQPLMALEHASPDAPRVLVLFAGPDEREDSLAFFLACLGLRALCVDICIGGASHDMARLDVVDLFKRRIVAREFVAIFAAPPCQSYSIAHVPQLRSAEYPEGLPVIPERWRAYMSKHNAITRHTFELVTAAIAIDLPVMIENPADRGGSPDANPAYWRQKAARGSLWRTSAARSVPLHLFTFAQCAFGAPVQKWTTVACSGDAQDALTLLSLYPCKHGTGRHPTIAQGRDESGASRSAAAAAYPTRLNAFIAAAIAATLAAKAGRMASTQPGEQRVGGRVDDGCELAQPILAAVELARRIPPRFASMRNKRSATDAELDSEPCHDGLFGAMRPSKERGDSIRKPTKGKPLPTSNSAADAARERWLLTTGPRPSWLSEPPSLTLSYAAAATGSSTRPTGPIAVHQLFFEGVYERHVGGFLRAAQQAATALLNGKRAPTVETVVLPQETMPTWARGAVWDARDPLDCRPVERSTRDTVFNGARQADRAAIRRVADTLGWLGVDADLIQQIGEGGVETRSQCALTTVLAWHHQGFERHMEAAVGVTTAETADLWVSAPFRHTPFVPCRCLPRGVVMQDRTKLQPDGTLQHYMKPRITTDCSDGREESPNGGLIASERHVELSTVQQHGRAVCIVDRAGTTADDEAAGEPPVRAEQYAVDATSAYREGGLGS
jgi:hypothetical protein